MKIEFKDLGAVNVSLQYGKRVSTNKDGSFVGSNDVSELDVTYIRGGASNLNEKQQKKVKEKIFSHQLPQESEKDQFDYQIKITTKKVIVTKTREKVSSNLQIYSLIFIPDYIKKKSFQQQNEVFKEEFEFQAEDLKSEGSFGFIICCTFENKTENKNFNEFLKTVIINVSAPNKNIKGDEISTLIADYLIKNDLAKKNIFVACKKFKYSDYLQKTKNVNEEETKEEEVGLILIPNNVDNLISVNTLDSPSIDTPKKEGSLQQPQEKTKGRIELSFTPKKRPPNDQVSAHEIPIMDSEAGSLLKEGSTSKVKSNYTCFCFSKFFNFFSSKEEVINKDDEIEKLLRERANTF